MAGESNKPSKLDNTLDILSAIFAIKDAGQEVSIESVMRYLKGKANPAEVRDILKKTMATYWSTPEQLAKVFYNAK